MSDDILAFLDSKFGKLDNKSKKKESIEFDDRMLQIIREEYAAVMKEKKKKIK